MTAGLVTAVPTAAHAEPAPETRADRAEAAVGLLARHARQADEPVRLDVSALHDQLIAYAAAGSGTASAFPGRAAYLLDALEARTTFAVGSTTLAGITVSEYPIAAVTSFDDVTDVVHAAAAHDRDPSDFAGRDLVASLTALLTPEGDNAGWFRPTSSSATLVPTRSQAEATLALATAGRNGDTDAEATAGTSAAALRNRQLPTGAFAGSAVGSVANVEATLYAIEALVAEGSPSSVTASATAAAWAATELTDDGALGSGTDPGILGLAADALRSVGNSSAASTAEARVAQLQVTADVDPVYVGAVARDAGARGRLTNGTFDPLQFGTLVDSTSRGVLAFANGSLATLGVTHDPTPPVVEGLDTFTEGPCSGTEGVSVVVDYGYIAPAGEENPIVRCALGSQVSGWAALENAGVAVGSVPGFVGGALCQLNGVPAQGYPYCWTSEGYWSYWHAGDGQPWGYSNFGAANRAPALGTSEGWRFVPLNGAGLPPGAGPFSSTPDTTAPTLTFTDGPSGLLAPGSDATFAYTVDDSGADVDCRIDDGTWAPCDSPTSWDPSQRTHVVKGATDGEHVLTVRATDAANNTSSIQRSFTIGTSAALTATRVTARAPTSVSLATTVTPGTFAQVVRFELATVAQPDKVTSSALRNVPVGSATPVTTTFGSLRASTDYRYRTVATSGDREVSTDWTVVKTLPVTAAPAKLAVVPAKKLVMRGSKLRVRATGLAPGEAYSISVGKAVFARGTATSAGVADRNLTLPKKLTGTQAITVAGLRADRRGTATVRILAPKKLAASLRAKRVTVGGKQHVTVRGLAVGEPVTVHYRGKVVARGTANKNGQYAATFDVLRKTGKRTVEVRGLSKQRHRSVTFTVRP